MKKLVSILIVLALLLTATACGESTRTSLDNLIKTINGEKIVEDLGENTVKIGVFEPESGKFSKEASDEIQGIKLAYKLYPRALDRSVELVFSDNHSDPKVAEEAAQELIDAGCKIVLGSYSNIMTMAVTDIFEENKIVCICPSCTNPLVTTTTDYFFRVAFVDAFQGNSAAKYIIEYLPEKIHASQAIEKEDGSIEYYTEPVKCLILKKANDERATAIIERFQAKMESTFGDDGYAQVIEYQEGADMKPYLDILKDKGAEAVFFPSSAYDGEEVLFDAYQGGYKFKWIGDGDWAGLQNVATEVGRTSQAHLENVSYVAAFNKKAAATDMTQNFLDAAKAFYNITEPSEAMALGFDSYILALEAIKNAQSADDSELIRRELNLLREVNCATGSITYRAGNGDPVKDVVIETIIKGQIKAEYTAVPVWS